MQQIQAKTVLYLWHTLNFHFHLPESLTLIEWILSRVNGSLTESYYIFETQRYNSYFKSKKEPVKNYLIKINDNASSNICLVYKKHISADIPKHYSYATYSRMFNNSIFFFSLIFRERERERKGVENLSLLFR